MPIKQARDGPCCRPMTAHVLHRIRKEYWAHLIIAGKRYRARFIPTTVTRAVLGLVMRTLQASIGTEPQP